MVKSFLVKPFIYITASRKLAPAFSAHSQASCRLALACISLILTAFAVQSFGQNKTTRRTTTESSRTTSQTSRTFPAQERPELEAAQRVMIVIHRLSGWRLQAWFALNEPQSRAPLTEDFVHTRVVTGYALEDDQTIVARIPQAEIETFAAQIPSDGERESGLQSQNGLPGRAVFEIISRDGKRQTARFIGLDAATGLSVLRLEREASSLTRQTSATAGQSRTQNVLQAASFPVLPGAPPPPPPFADPSTIFTFSTSTVFTQSGMLFGNSSEPPVSPPLISEQVAQDIALRVAPVLPVPNVELETLPLRVRQPVRLITPRIIASEVGRTGVGNRVNLTRVPTPARVQLGEINGALTVVERAPDGAILSLRVQIDAPLSDSQIGAIAIDEEGRLVGITRRSVGNGGDGARETSATLLPSVEVRRAAARVLARQASVPQVWLGARGENLTNRNLQSLFAYGWSPVQMQRLLQQQSAALNRLGVLLTAVAPDTPAAAAGLRPGDIVTEIGARQIRSVEEFSASVRGANIGQQVQFTVRRNEPAGQSTQNMTVTFSQTLDAERATRYAEQVARVTTAITRRPFPPAPLMSNTQGLSFVALMKPREANEGFDVKLLVVSVVDQSRAARFGFAPGDIIESVGDEPATREAVSKILSSTSQDNIVFTVRRNGKTVKLRFAPESPVPANR